MTTAYPLQWPAGIPRTRRRQAARFKLTMAGARHDLLYELQRLKAKHVVISTNVPTRRDGLPYSNAKQPDDPGVVVYFTLDGDQMAFPCDKWDKVEDNVRAIGKTIEALRGIARWGAHDMMKAAFSGFKALPADGATDWRSTLGAKPGEDLDAVKARYRTKAAGAHPDKGGSTHEMQRINAAWEAAKKEFLGGDEGGAGEPE